MLLACVLLCAWAMPVTAMAGSLTVTVSSNASSADVPSPYIPDATVTLEGSGLTPTNAENGQYTFASVPNSTYSLKVTRAGFADYSASVAISGSTTASVTLTSQIAIVLGSSSVTPNPAGPGSMVSISYSITNSGASDVPVWLAGFFRPNGVASGYIADGSTEGFQTVTTGTHAYTRNFTLAADLTNGGYDFYFGLWGNASPGYHPLFSPLGPKTNALTITPSISGLVKSDANSLSIVTNSKVPDATVDLAGPVNLSTTTQSNGRYLFADIPAGTYSLTVNRIGFAEQVIYNIVLGTDSVVQDVTLASQIVMNESLPTYVSPATASPTDTITISYSITNNSEFDVPVLLGGGFSPEGTVTSTGPGNPTSADVVTVTPGTATYSRTFVIPDDMAAGTWDLVERGWGTLPNTFDPLLASTGSILNVLTITTSVSGKVKSDADWSLVGATVSLSGAGSLSTSTSSSGNYVFPSVPGGTYTLTVSKAGFVTYSGPVVIGTDSVVRNVTLTSQIVLNISSAAVTPLVATPGTTVTFSYSITNNSGGSISVSLGGYLQATGGGAIVEPPESTQTITTGTHTYSFTYALPGGMGLGAYDQYQQLWSTGIFPAFPYGALASKADAFYAGTVPDLSITKSHTGNFNVDVNGTYTITVSNAGGAGSTVQPITVTDTLPTGLGYVSFSSAVWSCSAVGQAVTCTHATALAAGASSSFTLTVSVGDAAAGTIVNTATVSTPGETNTSNNSASNSTTVIAAVLTSRRRADFDGDGKTDFSIWQRHEGYWVIRKSSDSTTVTRAWGTEVQGDIPVPGDYDGDGKTDYAVWRSYIGYWYILKSSDGQQVTRAWGTRNAGDIAVPGDYDGDGKTDIAVYRAPTATWYILKSSDGGVISQAWGDASQYDVPVPGDYDGDGKTDMAVWRSYLGTWLIRKSSDGQTITRAWGSKNSGDIPVPGDYDGDGKTDIAVWRSYVGWWYIVKSSDGSTYTRAWGTRYAGDVAVPGDYDGDGITDIAVWREPQGTWYVNRSSDGGSTTVTWGQLGNLAIPSCYVNLGY